MATLLGRDISEEQLTVFVTEAWELQQSGPYSMSRGYWVGKKRMGRAIYEAVVNLLDVNGCLQGRTQGAGGWLIFSPPAILERMNNQKIRLSCPTCSRDRMVFFDGEDTPFCSSRCSASFGKKQTDFINREGRRLGTLLAKSVTLGVAATLTLPQWLETIGHFNNKCAYCHMRPFTALDHFIPLAVGGGTTADNCIPVCNTCNSIKGYKSPDNQFSLTQLQLTGLDIDGVRIYLESKK